MTVSIPLVVIVGAIVYAAWRFMGLRAWQAIVCLLLGFLLAATTAAPIDPEHRDRTLSTRSRGH